MTDINFAIDQQVVYPSHGVGKIIGNEVSEVAGTKIELIAIEFLKEKMTLRVPVTKAQEVLRILSTEDDIRKATGILKDRARPGRGMWSRRAQEYEAKISSGEIFSIAEVVRDLYKNVNDPDRSYSERIIYESALGRLADEFSAVKGIDMESATEELVKILKSRKDVMASAAKKLELVVDNEEEEVDEGIDLDDENIAEAA